MRARYFLAALFAALFAAAALAAVPTPIGQSLFTAFVVNGGAAAANVATRLGWTLTPMDFTNLDGSPPGTGGDDSGSINAAIAELTTLGGGTLYLPPPPSGAYNICASTINLPTSATVTVRGAAAGTTIRILPTCTTPPTDPTGDSTVMYLGNASSNTSARVTLSDLRIDGYCLAKHDLDVAYSTDFLSIGSTYRNVVGGGSNVRFESTAESGFAHAPSQSYVGAGNVIENRNDFGHTCYNSNSDYPLYGLENHGPDSNFTGLVAQGAQTAYFYDDGGDAVFGPGAHGWGASASNSVAAHAFYLAGNSDRIVGAMADTFGVSGIYISGNGDLVENTQFVTSSNALIGVELAPGVQNAHILGSGLNWFSSATQVVQDGGAIDPSIVVANNSGQFSALSSDNRVINGEFNLDQYNAGASNSEIGGYFASRWLIAGAGGYTQYWQTTAQSTITGCRSPSGTGLILKPSGVNTPSSAQFAVLMQRIDGGDIKDLAMGSATNAQPLMLSFWAASSTPGTYSISLSNGVLNRSLVTTVNLTTSCAYYAIQIPPDVGGSGANGWGTAPGTIGMEVSFDLGAGSNYQTSTLNTWQNGRYLEAAGAVQASSINPLTIDLSGVRLRPGIADIPWAPRSNAAELALAQQFYQTTFPVGTAPAEGAGIAGALCRKNPAAGAYDSVDWRFPQQMRKTPTVTTFDPYFGDADWSDTNNVTTTAATVSISIASPAVVSWTSHGLSAGAAVAFSTTGALPTGLAAGRVYYVISAGLTSNSFEIAASPGGAAIATSGAQSGTQTASSYIVSGGTISAAIDPSTAVGPAGVEITTGATVGTGGDNVCIQAAASAEL